MAELARLADDLVRFLIHRCPWLDADDARDITYSLMGKVGAEILHLPDDREQAITLFRTALHRRAIDWFRHERHTVALADVRDPPPSRAEAFEHANRVYVARDVRQAVDALPERVRSAMLRFYVYGFSVREIAEQDNTTMAAVRSLIRRGRSVLRAKLARHDPAGERP